MIFTKKKHHKNYFYSEIDNHKFGKIVKKDHRNQFEKFDPAPVVWLLYKGWCPKSQKCWYSHFIVSCRAQRSIPSCWVVLYSGDPSLHCVPLRMTRSRLDDTSLDDWGCFVGSVSLLLLAMTGGFVRGRDGGGFAAPISPVFIRWSRHCEGGGTMTEAIPWLLAFFLIGKGFHCIRKARRPKQSPDYPFFFMSKGF